MKWWKNLFKKIRKAILSTLGVIVIEKLIGADDVAVEIDSEGVASVGIFAHDGQKIDPPLTDELIAAYEKAGKKLGHANLTSHP